jgi:hypothetical protein
MPERRSRTAVVSAAENVLAHVPSLCRYGSKPRRELANSPQHEATFLSSLRSIEEAASYPPHHAYLGLIHPRDLPPRPWFEARETGGSVRSILSETEFLGLISFLDEFELVHLEHDALEDARSLLGKRAEMKALGSTSLKRAKESTQDTNRSALPLLIRGDKTIGSIRGAHESDESLSAHVLLENLAAKSSGLFAVARLIKSHGIDPDSIDFVITCGEEAIGDRYQRGGGNLAKAIAGAAGLNGASGFDIKNFCAASVPALTVAASLVETGVARRIVVAAGGSLPKLAMKFQGQLRLGMPILEDVLGGQAVLVERDDGTSPVIRLDSVGRHRVSAGGSNPAIMQALVVEPLERLGLKMTDVDDYATELHNPEITEPQGSGNVPDRNYRTIAALAARRGEILKEEIDEFVQTRGMPGFAPTQGHIASAFCYLPHAVNRLTEGEATRVQFLAKGSLFLGRMCHLSDGMSFLLERNRRG